MNEGTPAPQAPQTTFAPSGPAMPPAGGMAGPTPPPAPKKSIKKAPLVILLILAVAAVAGFGGYSYGKNKAPAATTNQTATTANLTVPQGATILSQCAVGRGTQYALPQDIPTGPVYNVYKGKVIGLEFMVGKQDLFNGKSFLNLPMFNVKYDHVNIGLLSQGHAGFPVPHYHVDIFTVPNSVASAITCDDSTTPPATTTPSTTTPAKS